MTVGINGFVRKPKMDYKELIEDLLYAVDVTGVCEAELRDAATAIETLLAEREAAIRDLNELGRDNPDSCYLCKHLPCTEKYGRCIGLEWRGSTHPDSEKTESCE